MEVGEVGSLLELEDELCECGDVLEGLSEVAGAINGSRYGLDELRVSP